MINDKFLVKIGTYLLSFYVIIMSIHAGIFWYWGERVSFLIDLAQMTFVAVFFHLQKFINFLLKRRRKKEIRKYNEGYNYAMARLTNGQESFLVGMHFSPKENVYAFCFKRGVWTAWQDYQEHNDSDHIQAV